MKNCICQNLKCTHEIRTQSEFKKAIKVIKDNLEDETIKEIKYENKSKEEGFISILENGPWPDFLENYFECNKCKAKFRLHVETYHGAGGKWEQC